MGREGSTVSRYHNRLCAKGKKEERNCILFEKKVEYNDNVFELKKESEKHMWRRKRGKQCICYKESEKRKGKKAQK